LSVGKTMNYLSHCAVFLPLLLDSRIWLVAAFFLRRISLFLCVAISRFFDSAVHVWAGALLLRPKGRAWWSCSYSGLPGSLWAERSPGSFVRPRLFFCTFLVYRRVWAGRLQFLSTLLDVVLVQWGTDVVFLSRTSLSYAVDVSRLSTCTARLNIPHSSFWLFVSHTPSSMGLSAVYADFFSRSRTVFLGCVFPSGSYHGALSGCGPKYGSTRFLVGLPSFVD